MEGERVPVAGDVQEVALPPSNVAEQATPAAEYTAPETVFDEEPGQEAESMFSGENFHNDVAPTLPAHQRPFAASILAIAGANPDMPPSLVMQRENLEATQRILDEGRDYGERLRISVDRSARVAGVLERTLQQGASSVEGVGISPEVQDAVRQTYDSVIRQRHEDNAQFSAEYEAVERIRDLWTQGNDVEAYLTWATTDFTQDENIANPNTRDAGYLTADQVIEDNLVKSMVMGQRMEDLEGEFQESGWPRYLVNLLTGFLPTKGLFDRAGIMDDAGVRNETDTWFNFLMSGTGLQEQGEALWDLGVRDFAQAMRKDGPVMNAIRDNAGLFVDDPGLALQTLQNLSFMDENTRNLENVFGVLDGASVIPFTRIGRVTSMLAKAGARDAAVGRIANGVEEIIARGADDAAKVTGTSIDEVIENMEPTALNPANDGLSMGTDVVNRLATTAEAVRQFPEVLATTRFGSKEELAAAFEAEEKALRDAMGTQVKDITPITENAITGEVSTWGRDLDVQGNRVYAVQVTVGRKSGGGFASQRAATNGVRRVAGDRSDLETFQGEGGQWFGRFRVNVKEEGFVTAELDTPAGSVLAPLRSTAVTTDTVAHSKALAGENAFLRFQRAAQRDLKKTVRSLGSEAMFVTTEILKRSQNTAKWFSDDEFRLLYQRGRGSLEGAEPSLAAYRRYQTQNDAVWAYRNAAMYRSKAGMGYENVTIRMGDTDLNFNGIVDEGGAITSNREYYDVTNHVWVDRPDAARIKGMTDNGYIRIRLDAPFRIDEGQFVYDVIVKKADLRRGPLRREQLAYSEGPSREYTGAYWAKQASQDARGRLSNPNVFTNGNNINRLREWADTMNTALARYREGERLSSAFDEIFDGAKGFPSGDEFLEGIRKGQIDTKHDVEVMFDRDMPNAYVDRRDDMSRFVNADETPSEAHMRTTGRMYYSKKGEHVRDWTGGLAETVDPWETLNNSLYNVSRMTGLSGYKDHILERFQRTYQNYLELKNLDNTKSLYELATARIKNNVSNPRLRRQIKQEQASIQRVLMFETGIEKELALQKRAAAAWVLGKADNKAGQVVHDWVLTGSPIEFLRGWAFDMKLGLFNVGQFFIQSTTVLATMAMSPKLGLKGVYTGTPMFAWMLRGGDENMLDVLAKTRIWKDGGFVDEAEFKAFARTYRDSGVWEVGGDNFSVLNTYGPSRVWGIASKVESGREFGRAAFYAAERINRGVAARVAWGEAMERGLKPGTSELRDYFLKRTDDYSFNMMNASAAQFQHGLLSIPTQFWAYGFRMMEAMTGFGGKTFTARQRFQLIASQFLLAGTAGIPLFDQLSVMYEQARGEPLKLNDGEGGMNTDAAIARGAIDSAIYYLSGADLQVGAKVGTGGLVPGIIADLFNIGTYGPKSFAEVATGATGSIAASFGKTLGSVITYSMAEAGGETGMPVTEELVVNLFQEIATVNNATRAYYAHRYGMYRTKNSVALSNLEPNAVRDVGLIMGYQPGELDENAFIRSMNEDRDETVRDSVNRMRTWRQEAFNNPDKWEENRQKTNLLVQMMDPALRNDVLLDLNRVSDDSLNEYLAGKWEEEQAELRLFEQLTADEGTEE